MLEGVMRSTLLYLSERQAPRRVLTRVGAFNRVTHRFVAGETLDEAVGALRDLNGKGMSASLDHLGRGSAGRPPPRPAPRPPT